MDPTTQQAISDIKAGMPMDQFTKFYPELQDKAPVFAQYASDVKAGMPDSEAPTHYPELFGQQNQNNGTPLSFLWSGLTRASQVVPNLAIGAGKGLLSTVRGAANLGEKYLLNPISTAMGAQNAVNKVTGIQPGQDTAANALIPQSASEAQGTAQNIGKYGEQLGEFLLPGGAAEEVGQAIKSAPLLENFPKLAKVAGFLGKTGTEALTGAGIQAEQQGNLQNLGQNAALMGGLSAAGSGLAAGGKLLSDFLPGRLINSALKTPLGDVKKSIRFGGDTLGDQLLDRGMWGTDKSILKNSGQKIDDLEAQLQGILSSPENAGKIIKKEDLYPYFEKLINNVANTPGKEGEYNKIVEVYNQIPDQMNLFKANEIKRNLYNELGDPAYKINADLSTKSDAMKATARGIKTEIENQTAGTAGEGVVQGINQDLAVYGKARDRALSNVASAEKRSTLAPLLNTLRFTGAPILGAAGGYYGGRSVESTLKGLGLGTALIGLAGTTLGRTGAAALLKGTGNLVSRLPAGTIGAVGKLTKGAILRAMQNQLNSP